MVEAGARKARSAVEGDGAGTIWAYVLHTERPGAPTRFAVPNLEMNGGIDYLVTLGKNGIHVIDPQTFNGGGTVDGMTSPLGSPGAASVTGLASDYRFHVYAAVGNAVLAFDTTPGHAALRHHHDSERTGDDRHYCDRKRSVGRSPDQQRGSARQGDGRWCSIR